MFEDEIKRLKRVDGKTVEIYATGEYPVKAQTKVQAVAHYQNDGTKTISPARFVETAEKRADGWRGLFIRAIENVIRGGGIDELRAIGRIIAKDINAAVNRIDTGRLKRSMRYRIK